MLATAPDLRFRPVETPTPKRLTSSQIDHYNREGWTAPFDALSPEETTAARAAFDRYAALAPERAAYGLNCYQARLSSIWDLATHPAILDHVEDILGPDIVCWATAFIAKPPHDPRAVPWHQDANFWALTPARTVTVWLAVDDADADNAAMCFLPRSHDRGPLPTRPAGPDSVFHIEVDAEGLGAPISNDLAAGQISLHADMLVHGSPANPGPRRRCALTLRYCPPEVRVTDPAWAAGVEAVVCRGDGGTWQHHPRPDTDDPRGVSSPHVIGAN